MRATLRRGVGPRKVDHEVEGLGEAAIVVSVGHARFGATPAVRS
jgi:hypothetical protein